ncbi:hypothetical protein HRR80_003722 [Exophiala dermatitidis]|uniref:Uncharacterized protein n=2 Tax=Exophiala dermatitidis TaxID=5970 RepID=H6BXP0_EXODN|nr:uncharacterized protein HMPREF1120_04645 [Exophiala dermatitidis NIH/UT8656]KAJ4520360.1 hypothetical protein HRR75_002225 [Exophiala dermatitidis]EHY56567.1 hypothetical protein HMPREF1120_04645 [Exophiala dermatitidis NIH/UT8656]KAJ4525498.1 hypothetical protein HRR73_002228 [Exophiala dermatitidis]KAJ4536815.1 hypothetical protein HRR76_004841 [Exophiala dermatitidis]KAJ4556271.1 hypothetical protein HRR78_001930 [Exophiala dermatitidis]
MAGFQGPLYQLVQLAARAVDDNNQELPGGKSPAEYAKQGRYNYAPAFAPAVVFSVLYAIAMAVNAVQFFRHRAWFWWVMNFAVAMELVGYITRAISVKQLDSRNIFIVQLVMILIAPAVMAAACYMSFGRVVLWVIPREYQGARHLWVPARRVTPVFAGCDVASFFVQVAGGSMIASANTSSKLSTGRTVVLVGLALQLATFGFFVVAALRLMVLLRTKLKDVVLPAQRNWPLFLFMVNVANVLILIRTTLRLIEYAIGDHNYLVDNEWFFYVFDSVLMFLVVLVFLVFHPGHYLPYLGIRRKEQRFSKNADKGLFARFARGDTKLPSEKAHNEGGDV